MKKAPYFKVWGFFEYGGETQDRTGDTRIFNPLLYLLSYHAEVGVLNNVYKKTSSNFRIFCNKCLILNHKYSKNRILAMQFTNMR